MVRRGRLELWQAVVVVVTLGTIMEGDGTVTTYQLNGKKLVTLTSTQDRGGIVQISADEYGNDVV